MGAGESPFSVLGTTPRITSLLIKPASAVCNLDCAYCFYLDREADPYKSLPARRMTAETLERLVDTYLFYSYPNSMFAFQGGEPTLAGLPFFEKLVGIPEAIRTQRPDRQQRPADQRRPARRELVPIFHEYNWLLGVSLDGPEAHARSLSLQQGRAGAPGSKSCTSIELLQKNKVEFNVLCVLSQANVDKPKEALQVLTARSASITCSSSRCPNSTAAAIRCPSPSRPNSTAAFMCEIFELWWPERRKVRIRYFDNIAEALAGQKPGNCTMHETCDSYVVVEYNGDVYPCDFFVEGGWKLGNINLDSWPEIARRHAALQLRGEEDHRPPRMPGLRIAIDLPRRLPEIPPRPARRFRGSGLFLPGVQDDFRQIGRAAAARK